MVVLDGEAELRILDAPRFVATKLESHASRGAGNYFHHDIEDIVAVIDGRPTLVEETRSAPKEIREFLSSRIRALLEDPSFMGALSGHLLPDDASQDRLPMVVATLRKIAAMTVVGSIAEQTGAPRFAERFAVSEGPPSSGLVQHRFVRSSNLLGAQYDAAGRRLRIEFRNGRMYAYDGVPFELYAGLTQAYSAGRYFNLWIKSQYPTNRVR